MKFTTPLSIQTANLWERNELLKEAEAIGYKLSAIENDLFLWNKFGGDNAIGDCSIHDYNKRYCITLTAATKPLILSLLAMNDDMSKCKANEVFYNGYECRFETAIRSSNKDFTHENSRKATLAEVLDCYGYELDGMDIVQKGAKVDETQTVSNPVEREVAYWEALTDFVLGFDTFKEGGFVIPNHDNPKIAVLKSFNLLSNPFLFRPHYKEAVTYKVGDRFSNSELDVEYTLTSFTLNQKRYILLAGEDGGYYEEPIVFTGNLSSITPAEFAAICGGAENVNLFTKIN
jgi:hypothetical protein